MCHFLSFLVGRNGEICVGDYSSHGQIQVFPNTDRNKDYREAEWRGDSPDTLSVRVSSWDSKKGEGQNWWRAQVLGQFKTRSQMIKKTYGVKDEWGRSTFYKLLPVKVKAEHNVYVLVESTTPNFTFIDMAAVYMPDNSGRFLEYPIPGIKNEVFGASFFKDGASKIWGEMPDSYQKMPKSVKTFLKLAGLKRGRNRYYL